MDNTYLFKTGHTADETQIYRTGTSLLDQSGLSRSNAALNRSFIPQPVVTRHEIRRPSIGPQVFVQPLPQRVIRNIPQPIPQAYIPQIPQPTVINGPVMQNRLEDQIFVYCPVCRRDYLGYQADIHAQIHNESKRYDFTPIDDKFLDRTKDSITEISPKNSTPSIQYPLVEPLEFWTNQLSTSAKNDVFIYRRNKNYDAVDPKYFNPPPQQILTSVATGVGVLGGATELANLTSPTPLVKPPLQYESNDTNIYNCLDNLVNKNNGPKFTAADITKRNKIITPKRPLQEYIIDRRNNPTPIVRTNNVLSSQPISQPIHQSLASQSPPVENHSSAHVDNPYTARVSDKVQAVHLSNNQPTIIDSHPQQHFILNQTTQNI